MNKLNYIQRPCERAVTIETLSVFGFCVTFRFYVYKLPRPHEQAPEEGLKYLLLDEQTEGWTEGGALVRDSSGALGRSLGPLYEVRLILKPVLDVHADTRLLKRADAELRFLYFPFFCSFSWFPSRSMFVRGRDRSRSLIYTSLQSFNIMR